MKTRFPLVLLIVVCLLTARVRAGDWPQFRYDVGRTAASPHELPTDLQPRWSRVLSKMPAFKTLRASAGPLVKCRVNHLAAL